MYKIYCTLIVLLACLVAFPVFGQEAEPNNTIADANPLGLGEFWDADLSDADTIDVWKISVESDKMYSIGTQTDPLVFNAKNVLEMDVVDGAGNSVLNASPSGRYEKFGCLLRAWTPETTGDYFVKIWGAPDALAAETDPSYKIRLWYGTPLTVASTEHEPDDDVAGAGALPAVATDGTVIHGYLYNEYTEGDTFTTNWNDFDLYKVEVPQAGMVLIAETTTPGRLYDHPEWIRETDTEITLLDATGAETPIKNDDKDVWVGDPWEDILTFNNTFSRFISPPIPNAGTWYIRVNSYYNSVIRTRNPHESHKNAGGGEYLLSVKLVAEDDPSVVAENLPLNDMKDGSISDADTMDVWAINVKSDRMYSIGTQTDPLVFNAKNVLEMDVVDGAGNSVLNASPSGRYEKFGCLLRAWTPEESGIYYVKVWGAPDALAAEVDPSYNIRLWYGTPLTVAATTHEPDNDVAGAGALPAVDTDGTVIHGYLYNEYTEGDTFTTNWNDFDLYKVEVPEAGMVLIAETTTPGRLYDHPEWIRETDTEITLLDATGAETPIKNDDKDVWVGDPWEDILTFNNTFSRFISPPIPNAGTWYIRVNSYYNSIIRTRNPHESHKNAGGGEYLLSVKLVPAEDLSVVAQDLPLNSIKDGSISDTDTMDVWAINVKSDRMYSIGTQTDPLVFNAKNVLEMDVVDEAGISVLNASPSGRYEKFGCLLRAWTPEESGIYYVKIWGAPDALAAEADPSYAVRLWYGTPLEEVSTVHEPDDSVAVASALPAMPLDGTVIHGYLYNDYTEGDTFRTNWNDFDLYKVEVPEAGMILIAETTTPGRLYEHPEWIRETDTEITLLDENGAETPIKNDDKDVWAGDPWEDILTFNNTFSRFVSPPIPDAGTWYIRVNSYYNSVIRSRNPHESHKNAGGGEYLISARLVSEDDPSVVAQNLPLGEIKDGSISETDTMDVWAINAQSDKMYSIATQTDPLVFNAKSVLQMDVVNQDNESVLNSSPSGRYEKFGCILRAWTPEESGVYYVKIWGVDSVLAAEEDPSYSVRFWYGTPLEVVSTVHEPDDSVAVASALPAIPLDGTVIHGYLYNDYSEGDTFRTNWNDFDLYKVEIPEAGMILTVETTTPGRLYDHPEWIRETDTEVTLLDENGVETPIKNDDKDVWSGDPWEDILTFNNTFSRFISPPMPNAGTWYIRVNSYYNSVIRSRNPHESHKNAGGGEYLLSASLTLPAEQEPNNDIASANVILLETVTDAALDPDDSMDFFKFWADSTKMYTLNTIVPRGVNAKSVIEMDLFDANGDSVLASDPSSRYDGWGARLTGWVPPATGFYYCKISADVSSFTEDYPYQIRLWYGTPVSVAATVHEPDDSAAVAQTQTAIDPAEGFEIHSYLYADYYDTLGNWYNWNDFDLYKVDLAAGDTLVAETFTAGPDSCIRDLDTEIYLLDENGDFVGAGDPIKNDDKDVWDGDPWESVLTGVNNTFSRLDIGIPDGMGGTYYIQVNSYYNSRVRTKNPANFHKDPGGGEYKLTIGLKTATGVASNTNNALPTTFDLSQNYPNPFNPTTKINYSVPQNELVKITIYNMLGQKVVDLVNERQQAGYYSIVWNAKDISGKLMPSGIYFCKFEAGSFVKVNKMILLK